MKKLTILPALAMVLAAFLIQTGCGGDDGPNIPPTENCSIVINETFDDMDYLTDGLVRIRWVETGSASEVDIDLLKGGELVGNIGTFANDGYKGWDATTMGSVSGTDFSIHITAVGESGCSATSDEFGITNTDGCAFAFTLEDTTWLDAGNEYEITWESNNTTGTVDIELLRGDLPDDEPVGYIISGIADDGSYMWTVDSLNEGTYQYFYLRISDSTLLGCSDTSEMFGIVDDEICEIWVNEPQPNAVWTVGETRTITFTAPDTETSHVNIRLYEGITSIGTIANMVATTGLEQSVPWVVDTTGSISPGTTYKIKIIDATDLYCEGWSAPFTINEIEK